MATVFQKLRARLTELLERSVDQEAHDAAERKTMIYAQQTAPKSRKWGAQVVTVTQSASDFDGVGQPKH